MILDARHMAIDGSISAIDSLKCEIAELWVAKVALLTSDDKFVPQRPQFSLMCLFFGDFLLLIAMGS